MTYLQRYLAEEIVEDHADGLVSRREALRRLGLLGLSSAVAASMLAGIVADEAKARLRAAPAGAAGPSRGGASDSRDRVPGAGRPEAHGGLGGRTKATRRCAGHP